MPSRQRLVRAGARRQQLAGHPQVAGPHREQERREAAVRAGRDVRAPLDQCVRGGEVVLGCRPHQRGLAAPALAPVRVRPAVEEQACTASARPVRAAVISAVSPSGVAQFGSAPASRRIPMNAALPFSLATASGVASKRLAASASAPAAEQGLGARHVVVEGRPVERRRAVAVGGVGIEPLRQQRANALRVAAPRRLHERGIRDRGPGYGTESGMASGKATVTATAAATNVNVLCQIAHLPSVR